MSVHVYFKTLSLSKHLYKYFYTFLFYLFHPQIMYGYRGEFYKYFH
jgi:hypothetical protein